MHLSKMKSTARFLCKVAYFFVAFLAFFGLRQTLAMKNNKSVTWVQSQFEIFADCHMKIITLQSVAITDSHLYLFSKGHINTFSLENFLKDKSQNSSIKNYHETGKFETCFVHVYIALETSFKYFYHVTSQLQIRGEWAHHHIFIETLNPSGFQGRNEFYQSKVPISNVRGVILVANIVTKTLHLMCVPCAWWFGYEGRGAMLEKVNLDEFINLEEVYLKRSLPGHSNLLYSKHVVNTNYGDIVYGTSYCELMSKPLNFVEGLLVSADCIHHLIRHKFNYSVVARQSDELNYIFSSNTNTFVSTENLNNVDYQNRKKEWLSVGTSSDHISLVGFQNIPRFDGNVLLEPYDWISWCLSVTMAAAMFIVTVIFACKADKGRTGSTMFVTMATSIIAGILEQPTQSGSNISHQIKLYKSEILGLTWLLWATILITLVNGYKGILFSLLATGSKPIWPATWGGFVNDQDYCFITTQKDMIYARDKLIELSSYVRSEYLKPMMKGTPGVSYPIELVKLNGTLKFFDRDDFDVVYRIIRRSWKYKNGNNENGFIVYNRNCLKFVLIESNAADDSVSLIYHMRDLAVSDILVLPGFRRTTPVFATRNFFTDPFLKGIAALEQGGILHALNSHISKWKIYRRVRKIQRYLTTRKQNVPGLNQTRLRSLTQISGHVTSTTKLREKSRPKAFTSQQLITTYKVFLYSLGSSIMVFLLEQVISYVRRACKLLSILLIWCMKALQGW